MKRIIIGFAACWFCTSAVAAMDATVTPTNDIAATTAVKVGAKSPQSGSANILAFKFKGNQLNIDTMALDVPSNVLRVGEDMTAANAISGGVTGAMTLLDHEMQFEIDTMTCVDILVSATPAITSSAPMDMECCCDRDSNCQGGQGWSSCDTITSDGSIPTPQEYIEWCYEGATYTAYMRGARGSMKAGGVMIPGC